MKNDIKNTVSFIIFSNRIEYLGTCLTKHAQDLYVENYKMLMKKIKNVLNK